MLVLISGTVLFPDTFTDAGLHLGPLRISVTMLLYMLTAPQIIFCIWRCQGDLSRRLIDILFITAILFITTRGLLAADQVNVYGLTLAYGAYSLLAFYGLAIIGQHRYVLNIVFISISLLSVLVAVYALLEFVIGENILFAGLVSKTVPYLERSYYRSGSTLGHPVALGLYLVETGPLIIYMFARARSRVARSFWFFGIIVVALALESTLTKGSWIPAMLLGLLAGIWFIWRNPASRRGVVLLLLSVGMAVAVFSAMYSSEIYDGIFSYGRQNESIGMRKIAWSRSPDVIADSLLFGVGMWHGGGEVSAIKTENAEEYNKPLFIDNIYITLLVENGMVGLVLMGAALLLIGREIWRLLLSEGELSAWAIAPAFGMIAVLINGLTANTLLIWPGMLIFWVFAGMIRAMAELNSRGKLSLK